MRFVVEHAGTSIEGFKDDKVTDLTIGLVIRDTFRNVAYMTSVEVEGKQLKPVEEDEVQKAGTQISKILERKWKQLTEEEKATFLKELKDD